MRHEDVEPFCSKRILEKNHQIALDGIDVRRHIEPSSSHQNPIDLIKPIFGVVDDKRNQQVQPITSNEINESTQRKFGPWRLKIRHKEDSNGQCRDEPSEVDAIHNESSL